MGGLGQVLLRKVPREKPRRCSKAKALFGAIGDDKGQAIQATVLGNAYMNVENFHAAEESTGKPCNCLRKYRT